MNRAQRRYQQKHIKKYQRQELNRFDNLSEEEQIAFIKSVKPDFKIEDINRRIANDQNPKNGFE
jgi:hypothetical protein